MMMVPPIAVAPAPRRKRAVPKRAAKKASKKAAKKVAKKSAGKAAKKSVAKKSAAKKSAAKKTKQGRQKDRERKPARNRRKRWRRKPAEESAANSSPVVFRHPKLQLVHFRQQKFQQRRGVGLVVADHEVDHRRRALDRAADDGFRQQVFRIERQQGRRRRWMPPAKSPSRYFRPDVRASAQCRCAWHSRL